MIKGQIRGEGELEKQRRVRGELALRANKGRG